MDFKGSAGLAQLLLAHYPSRAGPHKNFSTEGAGPVRIVYYVHGWPPDRTPNGVASAAAVLAPALRASGHDARLLALVGGDAEGADGAAFYVRASEWRDARFLVKARDRLWPQLRVFGTTPDAIAARIRATPDLNDADIFEIEESFGWSRVIARQIAPLVAVRLHGPYFLTGAAGGDILSDFDRERIRREGAGIGAAAAVTAPSKVVLEEVRRKYGLPLAEAAVIPNAVNACAPQGLWRLDAADCNEILFVGRFDKIKGADILLKAFSLLASERPTLKLTFAGPNDAPLRQDGKMFDYRAFIANMMAPEIASRVEFLGKVAANDIPSLRRRAFVTVVSSRMETFSNVLAEAMAAGSPVVAAKVGGMPELAQDGVHACFTESENPQALATAIAALLDAPERAAALGDAGRRRVETEFAPKHVATRFTEYYVGALARARSEKSIGGRR